MYINFSEVQGLAENLEQTVFCLKRAKEKIEYERKRLALNSELDDVAADLKITAEKLGDRILTARKLRLSLIKISQLYANGEERIQDSIEGGRCPFKLHFIPMHNLISKTDFRWSIE